MTTKASIITALRTHTWRQHFRLTCGAKLLTLGFLLGSSAAMQVRAAYFPIAPNSVAMSMAFDGTNCLVGLENPGPPHTIGAQLISASGTKIGGLIPTGRTGIATGVAFDGTNYLLIWEDDALGTLTNESYQVYGQFISRSGTPVGSPFNISGLGVQFDGIKTMAFGGGNYLVTYTRLIVPANGDDSENVCIAGRMVTPDGSVGNEIRISAGNGKESDVAFDGTNFFVVWRESLVDTEIRGRFVSPAGVVGSEISVNASPAASDNPKSLAFNGTHYLVVWNDEVGGTGTWEWNSLGQLVSPSGALVGGPITITSEPGPQMVTSVASDGANYLAVWADMQNGTNWDVYGQFVSPGGSLIGSKIPLSTDPGNQMGGAGFADGKYFVLVNNGVMLGEGGIASAESATGLLVSPPARPQVQTGDASFGIRTNQFGFNITGINGQVVVVEACSNLAYANWTPVNTNVIAGGSVYFGDPQWINYPGRFYRLRPQ